ncbi:hypothetical protein CORC01_00959 [Colletotrichum orchidophilum]|uniref:Uncharacterized protein n=1 Tax=Colletotrichum orchidophilum TaxID=1209926 RepID=A0A1G4BQD4_9PEZI|nr:uncharacterized protein CORC01_00959 [Colletotrichum orchidophilum]OHF03640.1 hypothetical protein CORC01_00959 [Colletotrichum orchidophilum]
MHHGDLRDELSRLAAGNAAKLSISGPPPTAVEGYQVVGVDVEEGKVRLKDGQEFIADVVVGLMGFSGADGTHLLVRKAMVRGLSHMVLHGASPYRFTFPLKKMRDIFGGYPAVIDPSSDAFLNMTTADEPSPKNSIPKRHLLTANGHVGPGRAGPDEAELDVQRDPRGFK